MPRDSSGNYTLPLADVVGGDTILADGWANPTMGDVAQALTDSLSRNGQGGLLAPLFFPDGAPTAPSIAFTNETTAGLYREGAADVRMVIGNTPIMQWTNDRALVRNPDAGALQQIATVDQLNAVAVPEGTADNDRLTWNETSGLGWQVAPAITAVEISFTSVEGIVATNVGSALDELKFGQVALETDKADVTALDAHINTTDIHVPVTGATAIEVVATLPGTPDPNTIYIVTT